MNPLKVKRDVIAGAAIAVIGAATTLTAISYGIGSPSNIEPGAFPALLGAILVLLGLLVAVGAWIDPDASDFTLGRAEWRGWSCIVASVLSFVFFGINSGLLAAAFVSVLIAALGDRTATLRGSIALAAGMTVFAVGLFGGLLQIQIPIVSW